VDKMPIEYMNISVVAKNSHVLFEYLNQVCQVNGSKFSSKVKQVKVWHGDILPVQADRGDLRTLYNVRLWKSCQDHITNFENTPKLIEGQEYVVDQTVFPLAIDGC
jgi:hypothetical protein